MDVLFEMVNDRQYGLEVNYQSAWALANIAGESPSYREEMMSRGLSDSIALILDEIFDEINDTTYFVSGKMYISDKVYYAALDALLWSLANIARGGFRTAEHWEKVSKWLLNDDDYTEFFCSMFICLISFLNTLKLKLKNWKLKFGK